MHIDLARDCINDMLCKDKGSAMCIGILRLQITKCIDLYNIMSLALSHVLYQ